MITYVTYCNLHLCFIVTSVIYLIITLVYFIIKHNINALYKLKNSFNRFHLCKSKPE